MRELHISKQDLRSTQLVNVAPAPLAEGAARLKLDLFALTSNNITYAAMGEGMLGYWDFFPAPEGFGKVPVWGFATVIESNAPDIAIGARYYGYYPLAESLDIIPRKNRDRLHRRRATPRLQSRALQHLHRYHPRSQLRRQLRARANALPSALRHRLVGR